ASLLGGVDGVITSFAVVAGGSAGDLGARAVAIVGFSSIVADGLSMGVSEYLSSSAEGSVRSSIAQGIACFGAFVACGTVPVLAYLPNERLLAAAMLGVVELAVLGASRAYVVKEPLLLTTAQSVFLGAAAGAVAFGVGSATHALG
ncbi:MAG: VIT1/CCC1 transporter family protein, partial [Actinomycetota bacterium]|nr:VIT1/CCC1 transporter family protein [Actinomycetota bacterium]